MDLKNLTVRPIVFGEQARWIELMNCHHYLGFRRLVGTFVCYVALIKEEWVALLGWSWASLKNGPREAWIGWNEEMKEKRLRYIINNVRFLILPNIVIKNLASRVLALNLKRLPSDWERLYGHPVILAETFVDGSRFQGTCYKAQGWMELGQTRGFGKKGKGYIKHGCPKKVFIRPLHPQAQQILNSPFLSPKLVTTKKKETTMDVNQLPLQRQGGLIDCLQTITDPRKKRGIRHASTSILSLSVGACLSGARSYVAIAQWGDSLSGDALKQLGFKRGKPPSEPTIRRLIQSVDPVEVDNKVGRWLKEKSDCEAIAIDGKTLKGSHNGEEKAIQLLSAVVHKEGVIIAQKKVMDKTNEIPMVKELLNLVDIEGSMVTLDALHTQTETARYIVEEKKADYLLIAKDNQKTLKNDIASLTEDDFFSSPC